MKLSGCRKGFSPHTGTDAGHTARATHTVHRPVAASHHWAQVLYWLTMAPHGFSFLEDELLK
jgi:hypothetical protein